MDTTIACRVRRCASFIFVLVLGCFRLAEAQIVFEHGYFVGHDGTRSKCLILNADWKNNPDRITYKLETSGPAQVGTRDTWKEFGIDSGASYVLFTAAIDRSSNDLNQLDTRRNPSFSKEKVFLRRIISGKASLYVYEEENLFRLYFSVNADSVQPLIYKKYKREDGRVARNETFTAQLTNQLACPHVSAKSVRYLKYTREDIGLYIQHYNVCQGDGTVSQPVQPYQVRTHINFRLGVGYFSYHLQSGYYEVDDEWGPQPSFRGGLEAEFVMPFARNKWSLATEVAYTMFDVKGVTQFNVPVHVVYNTLEIVVGPRYRFFINKSSTIALGVGACLRAPLESQTTVSNIALKAGSTLSPWLAFGYLWRGLSAELRYSPPWNTLSSYTDWHAEMKGTPLLILGFQLH